MGNLNHQEIQKAPSKSTICYKNKIEIDNYLKITTLNLFLYFKRVQEQEAYVFLRTASCSIFNPLFIYQYRIIS